MMKITIVVLFSVLAFVTAKPGVIASLAYSAPLIAGPGIVSATSNQLIARNYNGIAAATILAATPIAAPLVAAAPAPIGLAPAAYTSPPLNYAAAYNYAGTPLAAKYISPLGSLSYAAQAQYLF